MGLGAVPRARLRVADRLIPLLAAISGSDINLKNLTAARSMIFFVAFPNGFFRKEFFDRKQKEEAEAK